MWCYIPDGYNISDKQADSQIPGNHSTQSEREIGSNRSSRNDYSFCGKRQRTGRHQTNRHN